MNSNADHYKEERESLYILDLEICRFGVSGIIRCDTEFQVRTLLVQKYDQIGTF